MSMGSPDISTKITVSDEIDCEEYIKILEDSLNEDEKRIYMAKYVYSKKIEEIANEENLTIGAVTMRLCRLRKKLKTLLEDIII